LKMDSLKIERIEKGKCSNCNENVVMKITNLDKKSTQLYCAKHYVDFEGEHEIRNDLKILSKRKDYKDWHPSIAKEIAKRFPKLANKYGKTLRKTIQSQEKRPKKKDVITIPQKRSRRK